MSTALKILKTLRNNWKKSTVAALALTYSVNYARNKYEILQMMRAYCEESKKFGEAPILVSKKLRHVTVIINPAARSGKGPALFEKYALPLLHLAGIRVSLIKTEHDGQAKALMDVMDNTDAVLIAGGDGTVLEVVTGLCRREDADDAVLRFPLGILPIGRANTIVKHLFWDDHSLDARLLAESAMAIVRGTTRPLNVMAIKGDSGKPVYAVSRIEWGIYRDVDTKISKYWYWGPLKSKMAYVFASMKRHIQPIQINLSYTLPCEGCAHCHAFLRNPQSKSAVVSSTRWWHVFIPRRLTQSIDVPSKDYSKIINEQCGVWKSLDLVTLSFLIETANTLPYCKEEGPPSLLVRFGPKSIGRIDFLKTGWQRLREEPRGMEGWKEVIKVKEMKLVPIFQEDTENWFSIDNENHEGKAIDIQLLSNKIHVFCK